MGIRISGGALVGTSSNGPLNISSGGTGATTAEGALTNLGAYPLTNPAGYITLLDAPVLSVSGKTGVVLLDKNDVGLNNVDNVPMSAPGPIGFGTSSAASFTTIAASGAITATTINETAVVMSTDDIDLSLGAVFIKTITNNTSFTVSNIPVSGKVGSFILDLTNAGAYILTWWAGVTWSAGIPPSLTTVGRDILGFITYDGGVTWVGMVLVKDVR